MTILYKFPFLHFLFDILQEMFKSFLSYWRIKERKNLPDSRLDGKTIIITGGSGGFGSGSTKELAMRGARVIVATIDENAETVVGKIREEILTLRNTGEIIIKHLDLSSFESVKKFATEIIQKEERIDVLINNAGIITKDKKLITKDGNEETIQVNYLSHVLLTLNLMEKMIETSDDPRIIFVSSLAHHRVTTRDIKLKNPPGGAGDYIKAYAISKYAIMVFVSKMATLKAGKILFFATDPGMAPTGIMTTDNWFLNSWILLQFIRKPIEGSRSIIWPIFLDRESYDRDTFFFQDGASKRAASVVYVEEMRKLVWEQTFHVLGLKPIDGSQSPSIQVPFEKDRKRKK